MDKVRIRRKDLKAPDEFHTITQRVVAYARENEQSIVIALAAILVLTVLGFGASAYVASQARKAESALADAYAHFREERYGRAATDLAALRANWPNTDAGRLALVYLGNAYVKLGKPEEAATAFQELLRDAEESLLRDIARYNLGMLKRDGETSGLAEVAGKAGPLRGAALLELAETKSVGVGATLEKAFEEAKETLPQDVRLYIEAQAGPTS